MIRTAFSTTACPDWTLERVAKAASDWGYMGVELRSFGGGGTRLACEPALTDPAKTRSLFAGLGLDICSIATGVRFDAKVWPPVLGHILLEREASVYDGRRYVDLTRSVGAFGTRVYAYSGSDRESRKALIKRIAERLRLVCDHARHDAAEVILENGGAFSSAEDLADLMEAVDHPRLACAYDLRAAQEAGDDPIDGAALLGEKLRLIRLREAKTDETRAFVEGVAQAVDQDIWAVLEWPRLWDRALAPAEAVLPEAAPRLLAWGAGSSGNGTRVA